MFAKPDQLPEGCNRVVVLAALLEQGIPAFSGSYSEVYLEKAFDYTGLRPEERLPVAKALGESSLMFLVHPTLDAGSIEQAIEAVQAVDRRLCQ